MLVAAAVLLAAMPKEKTFRQQEQLCPMENLWLMAVVSAAASLSLLLLNPNLMFHFPSLELIWVSAMTAVTFQVFRKFVMMILEYPLL